MRTTSCRGITKAVALLLLFSISQSYVRASSTTPLLSGRLTTRANGAVYVNGSEVNSGMTILSGAQIVTPDGIGATVDLGSLGQLDVAPKANLTVTFDAGHLAANVASGCVVLRANEGIDGSVTTPQGVTQQDSTSLAPIDVCIGNSAASTSLADDTGATVGTPQGGAGSGSGGGGLSKRTKGLIVLAAAVATTIIIVVIANDDDSPVSRMS